MIAGRVIVFFFYDSLNCFLYNICLLYTSNSNDELLQASEGAFGIVVLNMPIMQLVVFASIIGILWFGGNMVHAGTLTVGKLTSFMTYSFQILMSLMLLSMVLMMLSRSVASVQRIDVYKRQHIEFMIMEDQEKSMLKSLLM